MKATEQILSQIYHPHWNQLNQDQFNQAVDLFIGRLKVNDFDMEWLKGKKCLDAGCGSGRIVQGLLNLGAESVAGIDLNSAVVRDRIKDPRATIMDGDIRYIPFPDQSFDFVCCNGVVHHTENPEQIITELTRVLKKGGYLFLYVFDPDTVDWEVVDALREAGQKFSMERFGALIQRYLNPPPNTMFNFMDLIYAPIQRKFTKEELRELLKGYKIKFFTVPYSKMDRAEDNRLVARKL